MKLATQDSPNGAMTTSAEGEGEAGAEENAEGHGERAEASEPPVSLADLLG